MTLRNEKGELDQLSGIKLSIKKNFHSRVKAANSMAVLMSYGLDEMPTMAMTDGMTAVKSNDISSPGVNPTIELINLDTCKTYSFQFFCSHGPVYNGYNVLFGTVDLTQRRALFKTIGENMKEAELDCHGYYNRFATIKGVKPNTEGSLSISLTAIDPTPNGALVSLNAIKFHAELDSPCTLSQAPSYVSKPIPIPACEQGFSKLNLEVQADGRGDVDKNKVFLRWRDGIRNGKKVFRRKLTNWSKVSMDECYRDDRCYKLQITDKAGNGICCESGEGFYNLK